MLQNWHQHGAITCAGYRKAREILKQVLTAPDRWTYTDLAIAPLQDDEFDRLDLYHETAGGEGALARKRLDDALRAGVGRIAPIEAAD